MKVDTTICDEMNMRGPGQILPPLQEDIWDFLYNKTKPLEFPVVMCIPLPRMHSS